MTVTKLSGVKITGVACAVPEGIDRLKDSSGLFSAEEIAKISASTGVQRRHVGGDLCTSDLCFAAAEKLLDKSDFSRNEIDLLIFVSQTPDYNLPATSCCLQERLRLSNDCASFDVNLGCSGYVYGLWIAANMIAAGNTRRVQIGRASCRERV